MSAKGLCSGENFHIAVQNQKVSEIESLIKSGNITIDVPDNHGLTALMNSAKRGQADMIVLLLSFNASINGKDDSGKSALMHACINGQVEAAKVLCKNGANCDDFDLGGSSPLHHAVDSCNCELINWLIKSGVDVNIQDKNAGWTPLIRCASITGNKLVAIALIHNGANIDNMDNDGKTCLMVAVLNGHQQLVEVLLANNADITMSNPNGHTAYDIAVSLQRLTMIETMNKYMTNKRLSVSRKST